MVQVQGPDEGGEEMAKRQAAINRTAATLQGAFAGTPYHVEELAIITHPAVITSSSKRLTAAEAVTCLRLSRQAALYKRADEVIRPMRYSLQATLAHPRLFKPRRAKRRSSLSPLRLRVLDMICSFLPPRDLVTLPLAGGIFFSERSHLVYRHMYHICFGRTDEDGKDWHEKFLFALSQRPQGTVDIMRTRYHVSGTTPIQDNSPVVGLSADGGSRLLVLPYENAVSSTACPTVVALLNVGESAKEPGAALGKIIATVRRFFPKVSETGRGRSRGRMQTLPPMSPEAYLDSETKAAPIPAPPPKAALPKATPPKALPSEETDPAPSPPSTHLVVIVGSGQVGKSAITLRYVQESFCSTYAPNICDVYKREDTVDSIPCLLEVVDTAGQEEYAALRIRYYQRGDGFLLVYCMGDRRSFEEVRQLYAAIQAERGMEFPPAVLVANKSDLGGYGRREVSREEGKALAAAMSQAAGRPVPYLETSAKDNTRVVEAFQQLVRLIRNPSSEALPTPGVQQPPSTTTFTPLSTVSQPRLDSSTDSTSTGEALPQPAAPRKKVCSTRRTKRPKKRKPSCAIM